MTWTVLTVPEQLSVAVLFVAAFLVGLWCGRQ
jgi:hypothetical protein